MTLETQYKNYKVDNPESTLTFEEWKIQFSEKLEKAIKGYTKEDIEEMALDYIINTGGLPQTIEDWKTALWKFYEQLNKHNNRNSL